MSTALGEKQELPAEQQHRLVERGILEVAGMNQRIHLMKSFGAVTGFQADEVPLFEKKLSVLLSQVDPDAQERRFDRVATLAGLPGFDGWPAGATVDVDRLLNLRDAPECREIRQWIRNVDTETDEQIKAQFDSVREQVVSMLGSPCGKAMRFLVATVVGLIPSVGAVAGPLLSAGDTFLLEKVIGKPGPATILGRNYRSIFRES